MVTINNTNNSDNILLQNFSNGLHQIALMFQFI